MIDIFSLALTHMLLGIAAWRLLGRPDLDPAGEDAGPPPSRARGYRRRPREKQARPVPGHPRETRRA